MVYTTCLNCKNRYTGCHSVCETYKAYKARLDYIKKKKQEEQETRPIYKARRYAIER